MRLHIPAYRSAEINAAGFTILEVLVAFVITATALVVLFRSGSEALSAGNTAAHMLEATSRAQSRLAAACAGTALRTGTQSGDDGHGFSWRTQISRIASHLIRPEGDDTAPVVRVDLLSVSVTVGWQGPRRGRDVTLVTDCLSAGPADRP